MLLVNDTSFYNSMTSSVRHLASWVQMFDNTAQLATYSKNDFLKSWEIQRVGDNSKFFGFGVCHRLNLKLRDVNRLLNVTTANHFKVWICPEGYNLNSNVYGFPIFYVTEVHRNENTNELSITAYDRLYMAADRMLSETGSTAYKSIYAYAQACASTLGGLNGNPIAINFNNSEWQAEEYPTGANYSGTEDLRAVLDDVAEATQSIYYINYANQLVFKRLAYNGNIAPDLSITKSDYITLDNSTNRRLCTIYHSTALGDDMHTSTVESGTTQYIHDNPFWNTREDIATLLDKALENVGGATINQFECSWRGNTALEIGDKIALQTRDDDIAISYVLNDTITYDGSLTEKTEWEYDVDGTGATTNNTTTLGQNVNNTAAVVDKINNRIDLIVESMEEQFDETNSMITQTNEQVSQLTVELDSIKASVDETVSERLEEVEGDITIINEKVAALEITSDGITDTVTKIETHTEELDGKITTITNELEHTVTAEEVTIIVKQEISEGIDATVSSVTTTTGFTFNEEGLTIDKSDSELSTTITEDGMFIEKSGETVLTADHIGVKAANLHATTYLIMGANSRFEDYNGNRTGCYWVGS